MQVGFSAITSARRANRRRPSRGGAICFPFISMRWPISWRIRTSRCDIRDTHHKSKATCRAGQPLAGAPGVCATRGIVIGPKEMQRDIWLIANHPAVVRYWRNVKKLARSQLKYASTVEGHRRRAGQHQANMFNITPGCANAWPDVLAPLPTRLVCGATNGHTAEMY